MLRGIGQATRSRLIKPFESSIIPSISNLRHASSGGTISAIPHVTATEPVPPTISQKKILQSFPIDHGSLNFEDVQKWPKCRVTGLPNGLRIATEHIPWHPDSVTIGVCIDAGSRYETDANNGSAHFLEHLAFKGTNKRTREQLELEVENMGAHFNAYTSRETTNYYIQALKKDMKQAINILADVLTNSTFDTASIERERSVILTEMQNVYNETKEELIFDHLHQNCYQDCSLGRTILGPVENIKNMTRDDLIKYIQTYYTCDNMVIVGVGNIPNHNEFVDLIKEEFHKISLPNPNRPQKDKPFFRGCEYEERWDDMDYVYCTLAYETCGWNHYDSVPLMCMQQILGQWNKNFLGGEYHVSPLIRYLYSDPSRPIAENFMCYNTPYSDTGLFGVYGATHPYDFKYFIEAVRREMNRFGFDINESMLEDVRERLKATMLQQLNNNAQIMEEVGRQLLTHGRRIHPAEFCAKVDDVDVNAIKYAAHRYLIDRDHAIVAVGPTHEMLAYPILRQRSVNLY